MKRFSPCIFLIIPLIFLLFVSCTSALVNTALKKMGVYDNQVQEKIIEYQAKKIVFVPMHHIGKREFYNSVIKKADSLQEKGYSIFYEKIITPQYMSKSEETTYRKKIRKIMRSDGQGYLDTINNTLMGRFKLPKGVSIVNQPENDILFDISHAKNVDVFLDTLVIKFEEKHGKVILSKCDLESPYPSENHQCDYVDKKITKAFMEEFAIDYRNQIIVNEIKNHPNNKIAVFYGRSHYTGVKELLIAQDTN